MQIGSVAPPVPPDLSLSPDASGSGSTPVWVGTFCPREFEKEWRFHRIVVIMIVAVVASSVLGEGWIFLSNLGLVLAYSSLTVPVIAILALLLLSSVIAAWYQGRPPPREIAVTAEGLVTVRQSVVRSVRVVYPWTTLRVGRSLEHAGPNVGIIFLSLFPPRALAMDVERVVAERFPDASRGYGSRPTRS